MNLSQILLAAMETNRMIGTISIECNAKNPNMPLWPLRAYVNSPSSLRIRNVPKKIGQWEITSVQVTATYPDKTQKTAQCVLVGGVWVGTVEGSPASGTCTNGYTVIADGIDENGNPVNGYVLGRGDVEILKEDGTPIEDPTHFVTDDELDTAISSKAEISAVEEVAEDVANLANSLSDYYTKSETSSNIEISTALALKQDKLSDAQISSINNVVDERKTYFTFPNNEVQSVYVEGLLDTYYLQQLNPELSHDKILTATEVKIGTAVTGIDYSAFNGCSNLTKVTIPDSVVTIGEMAFGACYALVSLEIPDGVSTINNLFNYTDVHAEVVFGKGVQSISQGMFHYVSPASVTFKGKTMAEVQAMADYPWDIKDTSIIKTWNDASKEYVDETLSAYQKLRPTTETISANQSSLNWNLANPYVTYILTTNTGYYTSFQFTVDLTQMCNNYPDDVNGEAFIDANNFVAVEDGHIDFTTSNSRFTVEYETDYDQSIKSGRMYLFKFRQIGQRILVSCEMFGNAE